MAAQIAITLILVVGAGLLGRSLMKVLEVNPGFRVDKIIAMDVSLPWEGWDNPKAKASQAIFFSNLIDRLKQIPGVRRVGAASGLPLVEGGLPNGMFLLPSQNEVPKTIADDLAAMFQQKERVGIADFCVATEGYFQVLGIRLIRGRIFDQHDGPDSPHVAVISESLARDRWPNQDPIGHTIEFGNMDGDMRLLTIVGIVGDIHEYGLDAPPRPTVYVNLFQRPRSAIPLTMLSDADTRSVTSDSGEVPDVFASLFRFAGLAEIQRHSHRILRNRRAAACYGRRVWRDGLFGQPPHARNRRACRSRRGLRRRSENDLEPGTAHYFYWRGDWDCRFIGFDTHGGVAALWRHCHRSADFWRSDTAPGWGSAAGLFHSGAAGHQGRPHGRPALRIIFSSMSFSCLVGSNQLGCIGRFPGKHTSHRIAPGYMRPSRTTSSLAPPSTPA